MFLSSQRNLHFWCACILFLGGGGACAETTPTTETFLSMLHLFSAAKELLLAASCPSNTASPTHHLLLIIMIVSVLSSASCPPSPSTTIPGLLEQPLMFHRLTAISGIYATAALCEPPQGCASQTVQVNREQMYSLMFMINVNVTYLNIHIQYSIWNRI